MHAALEPSLALIPQARATMPKEAGETRSTSSPGHRQAQIRPGPSCRVFSSIFLVRLGPVIGQKIAKWSITVLPPVPSPPHVTSLQSRHHAPASSVLLAVPGTVFQAHSQSCPLLALLRILQNPNIISSPQDPMDLSDLATLAELLGSAGDVSLMVSNVLQVRNAERAYFPAM